MIIETALPMPTSSASVKTETAQIIGATLVEYELSLKSALRIYAVQRGVPITADEIDDLYSALADRALCHASQCTIGKVPLAWLKCMALNLVRERRRQLRKLKPLSQTFEAEVTDEEGQARSQVEIFEALAAKAQIPLPQAVDSQKHRAELHDLLPFVALAYHEVLRWSILEGLTAPQIAARTGQKTGSVHTQICRARHNLRAAWERWHDEN